MIQKALEIFKARREYQEVGVRIPRMPAPKAILDLVERFDWNREAYHSANTTETQVRREFLDPLFKAPGWDI